MFIISTLFSLSYIIIKYITQPGIKQRVTNCLIVSWLTIIFLAELNPYNLHDVSYETYFIYGVFITIQIFSFALLPIKNQLSEETNLLNLYSSYDSLSRNKLILYVFSILNITLLYYSIQYFSYIDISGIGESRLARFELGSVFKSPIEILFFNYFIGSLLWISKFLLAFGIFSGKIKNIIWLMSLSAILLNMSFGAGRLIIIEIISFIIFLYIALPTPKKIRNKNFFIVFSFLFIFYAISIFATAFRNSGLDQLTMNELKNANNDLIEHLIIYFTGSMRAFQYATENMEPQIEINYGLLTFAGLDEIFSYIMRFAGFGIEPINYRIGPITQEPILIGEGTYFNALYSALLNFYFDFKIFGVIVFAALIGFLLSKTVESYSKNANITNLFLASFSFTGIFLIPLKWYFQSGSNTFLFIIAIYISSKSRNSRKIKY